MIKPTENLEQVLDAMTVDELFDLGARLGHASGAAAEDDELIQSEALAAIRDWVAKEIIRR